MLASISLTVFNRTKLSEFCINSILETVPRDQYEFIVVDNGSQPDTIKMLKKYEKNFDKLVLDHKNNLGLAINDAWKLASPDAEWLIVFSNDFFCVKGWFENFKLLIESELKPDVVFCHLIMSAFERATLCRTLNGSTYYVKRKKKKMKNVIWFGAGLAIKKELVDLHNLKFPEKIGKSPWTGGSIYSKFGKCLYELNLKIVHLGKPCGLQQDCEFANPEYEKYYQEAFNVRHKGPTYERLRKMGGYINNPDKYYEGSNYKIGKHYRDIIDLYKCQKMIRKAERKAERKAQKTKSKEI